MKISDLPQPYRALAELRKRQDTTSEFGRRQEDKRKTLAGSFEWSVTPEKMQWWNDVDDGKRPPIPQSSLDELARLNLWPVVERLPYDEKPLPVGIESPPDGFVFIGSNFGGPKIEVKGSACYFKKEGVWKYDGPSDFWWIGGMNDHPIAAPSHLCNRLQPPKPAEPFTSVRLPDITPVFTRTEPHTVESYRAAIIAALESADNSHGASLVKFYPLVKTI